MTTLSSQDRRAYQANVWKAYLFHFLMHFQLWWAIWVLYLRDLRGFSLTQITILDALFWGTAVLAEVPTGAIADRFGRKVALGHTPPSRSAGNAAGNSRIVRPAAISVTRLRRVARATTGGG